MTIEQRRLAHRYLLYRFFTSLWFVGAVWLYFYRLFINDQQVGVLDGLSFAIGLLAEVPSGALADRFGRDRIVRLGAVLTGSGLIIQGVSSSFELFLLGQTVLLIGASFASGADEALFFERLKFDRDSIHWRKLVTRGTQAALVASVLANVLGGVLHGVNPRLTWIFNGAAFLLGALMLMGIRDGRQRAGRKGFGAELQLYLQDIKTGFSQFRLPNLRLYLPIILVVQGLFYLVGWGLLRVVLLDRFHFTPLQGSLVISTSSLITVALLALMHRQAHRLSERRVILTIALAAAASLAVSIPNIGRWGYFVILALFAGEHILQPFMSEVLNRHAPESQRATVLSVATFMRMIPYVLLAPVIGWLNVNGQLSGFLVAWSILIVVAAVTYRAMQRRDLKIELPTT